MDTDITKEEEIFEAAVAIDDDDDRARFLDAACAGNEALRLSVKRLLEFDDTPGDFLETPALGHVRPRHDEMTGEMLGPYRLTARLGEGGFGVVYRAEQQEPIRREVALKIIKLGMDTQKIIDRFEAERQALAMMNHPNIATVLDAGSTDRGRPYFVMELVEGPAIDRFCEQERLALRGRLELFVDVCRAVHHAHQRGIVHRDLKPSNILVADNDGQLLPKIIDFGIAKAILAPPVGDDPVTASQQLVGTPEYMSPEQITSDPDIDTRTDVYALGGVLYKLLVGAAPLETAALRQASLEELVRTIREQEPHRPSKRLATSTNRTEASGDPASCNTSTISSGQLRGDLDSIVMKALEKDRARRYDSVADLARDVERHLTCQPVLAGPPGVLYRARKFLRRNRVWMLATSLVLLALVAGSIAAMVGLVRAERERQNANQQEERAEFERQIAEQQRLLALAEADKAMRVAEMLEETVLRANPRRGTPIDSTVWQQLDEFAELLDGRLEDHPEVDAKLRRTIGRVYFGLGAWDKAEPQLTRALDLRLQLFDDNDPLVLQSRVDYALYLASVARLDEAEREVEAILPLLRQAGPSDTLVGALLVVQGVQKDRDDGDTVSREVWEVACEVYGADHSVALAYQGRAGLAAMHNKKYDEAERLARDALNRLSARWSDTHFVTSQAKYLLARVLIGRRKLGEAKQLMNEVIAVQTTQVGKDSKHVIRDQLLLADILQLEEKWPEAEKVARDVVEKADRALNERDLLRSSAYVRLAEIVERDRPGEAADLRIRAIELRRAVIGDYPRLATQLLGLATSLCELGRWDEAAECYQQAIPTLREDSDKSQTLALVLHQLADLQRAKGDNEQAVVHLREAISTHDPSSFYTTIARVDFLEALIDLGNIEEAGQQADELATLAENSDQPELAAAAQTALGQMLMGLGNYGDAAKALRSVLDQLGDQTNLRTRYRINGLLAHCRIQMGYLKVAERMLLKQNERCSAPLDRRRIARQLATLYEAKDDLNEAARWRDLLKSEFTLDPNLDEMQSRLRGKEAPQALADMMDLAYNLQRLEQYEDARVIFEQVLEHREQLFGTEHPETIASRMSLAYLCKLQRRLEEAEQLFDQAREESKEVLGTDHPQTLRAANQLAVVLRHQGRYEEAERLCRETLEARQRALGDRLDTTQSLQDMAEVCLLQGNYDEAKLFCKQWIEMCKRLFGEDDSRTLAAERRLERVRSKQSRQPQATSHYKRTQEDGAISSC